MLHVGDQAPAFSLLNQRGGTVSSESLAGTRFVIYFYPKDDTPGCTREACSFRDSSSAYRELGVPVFGVSPDTAVAHERFARKFRLDFDLLVDPERRLIEAYGVWVEKSLYGRRYMGVARATFVIGADGRVEKVWEKVSPDQHGEEVLNWLKFGDAAPALTPAPKAEKAPRAPKSSTPKAPAAASVAAASKSAASVPAKPESIAPAVVENPKPAVTAPAKPAPKPTAPARPAAKAKPVTKSKSAPTAKAKPAAKKKTVAKSKPARKAKPAAKTRSTRNAAPAKKAKPAPKAARPKPVARKSGAKKPASKPAGKSASPGKSRRK